MAGYVYLIGSPTFHWYKIGKSKDASVRVTELGILLPFRIEVIAIWHVLDHHEQEKLLHEKYANKRINGEWFSFHHNEIRQLIIDMSYAQVRVAYGFSNIQSDSLESVLKVRKHIPNSLLPRKFYTDKLGHRRRGERGGTNVRMDKLTKETQVLRARVLELEKLIDKQDLPTV